MRSCKRWGGNMQKLLKSYFKRDKIGVITVAVLSVLAIFLMIIGMSIIVNVNGLYEKKIAELDDYHILYYYKDLAKDTNMYNNTLYATLDKSTSKNIAFLKEIQLNSMDVYFHRSDGTSGNSSAGTMMFSVDDFPHKTPPTKEDYYPIWFNSWTAKGLNMTVGDSVTFTLKDKEYKFEIVEIFESVSLLYHGTGIYIQRQLMDELIEVGKLEQSIPPSTGLPQPEPPTTEDGEEQAELPPHVISYSGFGYNLINPTNESVEKTTKDLYDATKYINGIYTAIDKTFDPLQSSAFIANYLAGKNGTLPYIKIMGIAMIAFSVLVMIISVFALIFIINTSINADVKNIGVLKALGYSTSDLRKSYILLYSIVIGLAVVIGIVLGVCLMPLFVNVINIMANLTFNIAVFVPSIFIAVLLVVGTVIATVWFATARINAITPISALRKNISTHSFRKNRVPLDKTKGNVNVLLGIKSIFNNLRQSGVIFSMVLIMCVLLSFVSVAFYNLNVNQQAIVNLSGVENCDVYLYVTDSNIYDAVVEYAKNDKKVQNVILEDDMYCRLRDGSLCYTKSFSDYDNLRTNMLYKGKYPQENNEVVLNYGYAQKKGLDIGDSIQTIFNVGISDLGMTQDCIIVGITQSIGTGENPEMLVPSGLHKQFKNFVQENSPQLLEEEYFGLPQINLYLYPEYADKEALKTVNYSGPIFEEYQDLAKRLASDKVSEFGFSTVLFSHSGWNMVYNKVLNIAEPASDILMKVFFIVSALVILLLLAMIMKIKVMKEGQDYAILKALGYTSNNIMLQISLSMLIVSVLGCLIGCLVGALGANPLLDSFAKGMGVASMGFVVNWWYILAVFALINLLVFVISMLLSLRIRKITPAKMLKSE